MLPDAEVIGTDVARALREDVGSGDLTASLLPSSRSGTAHLGCRDRAVLAGRAWFDEVFRQVDGGLSVSWAFDDGDELSGGARVCSIEGRATSILTAERTALNFLQTLSGVATATAAYVRAVSGTGVRILDTRKTIPGLRQAEKYAVTCGGGHNHRMGLYDAILIKENHIAAEGSIPAALEKARRLHPGVEIEIEVENIGELEEALAAGAKRVLLDNFDLEELSRAVALNRGRARLEASGGVDLDSVRAIAETGVDDISVGAITKNLQSVDFSLRLEV